MSTDAETTMTRAEAVAVIEEVARKAVSFGEVSTEGTPFHRPTGEGLLYARVRRDDLFSGLYDRWRDAMHVLRSGAP